MMAKAQTKLWYLKRFDLFAGMSEEELKELDRISRMVVVKKGQPLYLPDDPGTSVFLLKSGRIKISRISRDGKEFILDIVEPGEIFGEMSIVDEGPQSTTGETLEDSSLCVIPKAEFQGLLQRRPDLAFKVTKLIGLRRKKIESRLEDLVFKDVPGRLATLLLQLARDYGVPDSRGILLRIKLSQREIANLIGASREMVNHTLTEFRRRGFIDLEGRRLIIIRQEALEQL
ncbi:MAG: Crp/Fnr family transcriptional regulator [candidate division NC10 bacterium]|nr:Crp/Fnr family transcriptional regulator [candidate division NC10 bacterium]